MTQGLTTTSWQHPYMPRTPRRPTSIVRQCCGIRSCGVTRLLQSWASGLTSTITSQVRAQWQSQPHCTSLCPGNLLPDYCNGNLYAVTPKVGLLLAEGAKHVFHHYHAEDLYLNGKLECNLFFYTSLSSGLVAERIPEISHRSLSPFLGNTIWDGVLTHCPLFSAVKHLFNPMVLGGGEANGVGEAVQGDTIEYFHSPYFFLCISIEHLNYQMLRPYGLFMESLNHICSRN